MRTIMAGLAEFERDLIRERVKSGLASARARGVLRGRQEGQCPSDKKANKVLAQHKQGLSYRLIGRNLGLSKNTAMEIVKRSAGWSAVDHRRCYVICRLGPGHAPTKRTVQCGAT